jgi:TonB-dependent SusC/RagA subfamily outer membrane receptor
MKISLAVTFTLCLASAAGAQQAPLCIIDGIRYPSTSCKRDWSSTAQVLVPGAPIIVVDGRVTGYQLDQANIVHVEIIKGAPAVTQYGPDAANGVILITTNRAPGPLPGRDDPLARFLFSPELVMAHQQEINLTDAQRSAIQRAIVEVQGKFADLQFRMSGEVEKLQLLLQPSSVDEAKVIDQVDHVLAAERDIKHAQLTLMIRIKNQLTEQQQTALAKLR